MLSGDKNVSFGCIIWTKEIFFRHSDTCPFLTKSELVYKKSLKRSVLKSQFQNPRNLGEKDSHKNNFQFTMEQKIDQMLFHTDCYGIIRSTNEILCKN